jgi:diguanylate cyclase (GGDEF)-like protein
MISSANIRAACLWTIVALAAPAGLLAQRYTFRQYGSAEGLSNLSINCLLQDRMGFLWVGTDNGLFRYDGDAFSRFGRAEGLPNTEIRSLAESPGGVLWVATAGGIARRGASGFQSVDTGNPDLVRALAFDGLGRVYLEYITGIVRGVPDGAESYRFSKVVSGATNGLFVRGIDLWFGKGGGVWHLAADKADPVGSSAGLPADAWDSFAQDSLGNFWVRSATRLYELPHGQTLFVNRSAGIPHAPDSRLYADSHGSLYISSDSGVVVLEGGHLTRIDSQHGLPADAVGPVLLDSEGSLWLGTFGGGLVRRLGQGEWLSWTKDDGLAHNAVWAILRDRAGLVWVGTSGGLTILGRDGRAMRSWTSRSGLTGDRVLTLVEGPTGDIFAGTDPGGISRFSKRGMLLATYGPRDGLPVMTVISLAVDSEQRLWVAGSAGCYRSRAPLSAAGQVRFERVDIPGLAAGTVFLHALVGEGGAVWLATTAGLVRFEDNRWKIFKTSDGLISDAPAILAQGQGALWLAYRDSLGITRLRVAGDRLEATRFTKQNGLSSDEVLALAFDSSGQLWASTDNGVDVFEQGRWRHYGRDDGLIWEDTDSAALYADSENHVWVGTSEGLSRYAAPPYRIPDLPPPVVLTSIQGGSQEFHVGNRPVLPHAQSSILVRFSSLNYSSEAHTRFRYRLQGFESAWNETRERDVHYAGLSAGRYIFEVVAAGPNGVWDPVPAQFAFSVKSAWWQTWWFLLACLAVTLVVGNTLWRFRVHLLLARNYFLEVQVAERTAEMVKTQRMLEEMAYHDMLTSLPNRRMFAEKLRTQFALGRRYGTPFGLLLIDLDRFKQINDAFGHDAGDAVLIETATRVRAVLRESDCAARMGGDEFAILLVSAQDKAGIEAVCRRIIDSFADEIPIRDANLKVMCSVGAAMFPDDGNSEDELYKSADLALYDAKRLGPNVYCWHPPELTGQLSTPAQTDI